MILNNKAQLKYLNNELKYNDIIDFITNNINLNKKYKTFSSINDILNFANNLKNEYKFL